MRPTRPFARTVTACCLAGCALAGWAQPDGGAIELVQTLTPPQSSAPGLPNHLEPSTQTMLWRHRGAVAFGVGVEQQRSPVAGGPGLQPRALDTMLVGVSFATGERTRLSWQTSAPDSGAPLSERPMKVSLSFQRTDALKDLRRGSLLRMELSGETTLALKARGGRLGFALTSRW